MAISMLYVTAPNPAEARTLGRRLVEERLAACANVLPGVTSFYWWDGKVQEEGECLLILKVARANERRAIARIKALHSYSVPCANAFRVAAGNPDYLAWVTREAPPSRKTARNRASAKAGRARGQKRS